MIIWTVASWSLTNASCDAATGRWRSQGSWKRLGWGGSVLDDGTSKLHFVTFMSLS